MTDVYLFLNIRSFLSFYVSQDIIRARDRIAFTSCVVDVVDVHHSKGVDVHCRLARCRSYGFVQIMIEPILFLCICTPPLGDVSFPDIYNTNGILNYVGILLLPACPSSTLNYVR